MISTRSCYTVRTYVHIIIPDDYHAILHRYNTYIHTYIHRVDEFITWPLEFIDRSLYTVNDTVYSSKFRDYASLRERYWIRSLWSLQPQGFNIALPAPKPLCRRFPNSQPENNFIRIQNDSLVIDHTSPGPTQHIREVFHNLLVLYDTHPQTLEDEIRRLSRKFRLQLLHWSYSQIPNLYNDDKITAVQTHLRAFNSEQPRKKKDKDIPAFIKIVHIHEAIQYANVRRVLRIPHRDL